MINRVDATKWEHGFFAAGGDPPWREAHGPSFGQSVSPNTCAYRSIGVIATRGTVDHVRTTIAELVAEVRAGMPRHQEIPSAGAGLARDLCTPVSARWYLPNVDAQSWTNVAVAGGTFLLAVVTAWMAVQTRRAVDVGNEQTDITRQAVDVANRQADLTRRAVEVAEEQAELTRAAVETAERQAQETAWARIDAQAPRVVVIPGKPEWPPYLERPWMSSITKAESGTTFTMPAQGATLLWFHTDLLLRNDGNTTALISLQKAGRNDNVRFASGGFSGSGNQGYQLPLAVSQGRYALLPGQTALVLLDTCRSVADFAKAWDEKTSAAEESKMYLHLIATDHFQDGISDNTTVVVQAYPITPVVGDAGAWRVRSAPAHELVQEIGYVDAGVELTARTRKSSPPVV